MRKIVAAGALMLGLVSLPAAAHAGRHFTPGLSASATQVVAGSRVVFKSVVHPRAGAAGQKIVLQEQYKPGAPWADQQTSRVGPGGHFKMTDYPTSNFVHSYRVIVSGSPNHAEGVSGTVTVKVYDWENLDAHAAVNPSFMYDGPVDINGTSYPHSISADFNDTSSIEYNLDHHCLQLRSTFGTSDASTTDGQAEVDVESDGTNVYSHTFDLGQSETATVALGSPLKIRLSAHSTSTGTGVVGYGAFGTAQVLCVD